MRPRTATLVLAGATVAVSFSAVFIRFADDDPATVVWVRMAIAALLLLPLAVRDGRRGSLPADRRSRNLVLAAGVFLGGHFLLWTVSLQYTSVAASVLLVSLHPVIVTPLGRRLLGEGVTVRTVAGIVLALAGTVVTCVGDLRSSGLAIFGDALAIGGAACLAAYLLIGRGVRPHLGVGGYSAAVYAVVACVAVASAWLLGTLHAPPPNTWLWGGMLAVVCTLGGHTVYNFALRHVRAATVSLAFLGEPPLTALLAVPLLHSLPTSSTIVGGVLILAGLASALSEPLPQPVPASVALE